MPVKSQFFKGELFLVFLLHNRLEVHLLEARLVHEVVLKALHSFVDLL